MKHTRKHRVVVVAEIAHDADLMAFEVYVGGEVVGTIYPDTLEDAAQVRAALSRGACPVCEGWEDGLGHRVTATAPWS